MDVMIARVNAMRHAEGLADAPVGASRTASLLRVGSVGCSDGPGGLQRQTSSKSQLEAAARRTTQPSLAPPNHALSCWGLQPQSFSAGLGNARAEQQQHLQTMMMVGAKAHRRPATAGQSYGRSSMSVARRQPPCLELQAERSAAAAGWPPLLDSSKVLPRRQTIQQRAGYLEAADIEILGQIDLIKANQRVSQ